MARARRTALVAARLASGATPACSSWDRVDAASRLLGEHLPDDLHGHAADLGCGYGYLSRVCSELARVWSRSMQSRPMLRTAAWRAPTWNRSRPRIALEFPWHDVALVCRVATTASSATAVPCRRAGASVPTSAASSLPPPRRR
ncbi:MAG: methyltransferase [Xanthomonadales bacterium]|nr:methyltransferase [Xanthomonadales bacterium]